MDVPDHEHGLHSTATTRNAPAAYMHARSWAALYREAILKNKDWGYSYNPIDVGKQYKTRIMEWPLGLETCIWTLPQYIYFKWWMIGHIQGIISYEVQKNINRKKNFMYLHNWATRPSVPPLPWHLDSSWRL